MTRNLTAWILGGLLAAGTFAAAEEGKKGPATVKKEDVRSWIMTIEDKEYEVHPATPRYDGDTGLFHMSTAYTLPKGKFSISLFRDNLDRDPKDVDISINGLTFAFGATSRLEIFGSAGFLNRVDTDALTQTGFVNDYPFAGTTTDSPGWQTGFGDIRVGAKFKILDDYLGQGVGLAIRGFVKLPTADETKGLGTGKVSGGGDVILSRNLGQQADIHASLGYQFNSDPDDPKRNIGNALKWGIGFNVPACRFFQLQAELTGTHYGDADFDQTNPIDLIVGPVIWLKPGLFIRPGISWNLAFDDRGLGSSMKSYTGRQISIGYHPGTVCCEIEVPPPPKPIPVNRPPTVACEAEKSQAIPGETIHCRARGSDPDGDLLSYAWNASAGRVTPSGTEVTYDSTGVTPDTSVSVTVVASDGKGATAEAVCPIRVAAPKPPVEPFVCSPGGFPRNLARLNNIDKACLDGVAARLKQDPRSRVVVVGHADKSERYPEVIGRKRAEAIKTYLVKERGIDEALVTVKSAGATKPLDTGASAAARAKNRRIDVIFVPEGATLPEDDD